MLFWEMTKKELKGYLSMVVLAILSIASCGQHQQHIAAYNVRDILGLWMLNNKTQVNYPTLEFKTDSTAVFTSRGDTVYRLKYLMQGDSLVLFDVYNVKKVARIIHLDSAKLSFNGLLEEEGEQLYTKVK